MFGLFAALFLFTPTPSALKRNQGGLHDWLITDAFLIWSSVRPLMVCYRGKMKIPNWTPCTTFIFRRCVWNSLSSKFKQLADDSSPGKGEGSARTDRRDQNWMVVFHFSGNVGAAMTGIIRFARFLSPKTPVSESGTIDRRVTMEISRLKCFYCHLYGMFATPFSRVDCFKHS